MSAALDQPTVLVIDDSKAITELASSYLESAGFTVVTAPSGTEGLEVADTIRPSAVLCNFKMPGMSGLDVLEGLRGNVSTRDVPFILMAAGSDQLPAATPNRPHDVIWKPFLAGQVVNAVTRVLAD